MMGWKKFLWIPCICVLCSGTNEFQDSPQQELSFLPIPLNLSDSFPVPDRNSITPDGIELGRMLFYDPILSGSNTISCATCHQPEKAFSDGMDISSRGMSGNPLARHVPALINLVWQPNGFFWDGGVADLESLSFGPITDPDEMGQNLKELMIELNQHEKYREIFKKVFGTDSVSSALVGRALAQFQRTLISGNSRYDRYIRDEPGGNFSELEKQGLVIFERKCSDCHSFGKGKYDFFTDYQFHNNGIDKEFRGALEGVFQGRFRITRDSADMGKFKTPTLRNITVTAPYMHDGRFTTLEAVLYHYSSGMVYSSTLDPLFKKADGFLAISITPAEKAAILAFLQTLTDKEFLNSKALANPFP